MDRAALVIVAAATVAAAYLVLRWQQEQDAQLLDTADQPDALTPPADSESLIDATMRTITSTLGLWRPPAKYAAAIAAAEDRNGIPRDLLARLLYQESRYREDIITGKVRSPVGALGIAQFMPATAREMGIDPLNPAQAIDGAGRYLARLHRSLGGWALALAAYNWGIGNVQRRGLDAAPLETRNYFAQILADVNSANGTAYA